MSHARSPPARRRGLKLLTVQRFQPSFLVASCAEAWIETKRRLYCAQVPQSPPARRRGLKLGSGRSKSSPCSSPPARRRGLKLTVALENAVDWDVASCAEAWIETSYGTIKKLLSLVASCAEAWIETSSFRIDASSGLMSPPARRRGLKHDTLEGFIKQEGRLLRGGVD